VAGKLHFFLGQAIEEQEHDHAWDTDSPRNRLNELVVRRVVRKIAPTFEIVGQKIVRVVGRNHMSVTRVNERKGAAGRADVDRLPEAVKHQNLTI